MRAPLLHGGGLRAVRRAFPEALQPWLDLSTGINPIAYPVGDLPPEVWTRLPEREEIADLEAVAARLYGAPDVDCIVAASGVQTLIQILPQLYPARSVAILGPTYEEHAHCWRMSGADVTIVGRTDELFGADVCVVVNPNNPDGRTVSMPALDRLAARGSPLIIDESFADVAPSTASFGPRVTDRPVAVLRSVGKFFGLAGLRLGFAITAPVQAARLRDHLGPWAVSGPAVAIGCRALSDAAWQRQARQRLTSDARRLDALLAAAGFEIVGGTSLFRLTRHVDASSIWKSLCRVGVLVRAFADRPDLLRFGLPGEERDWARLATAFEHLK